MLAFLQPYWLSILKYGAMVIGVLAVLFSARQSGKHAERVENLKKAVDDAKMRRDIEIRNSLKSDDIRERMRQQRDTIRNKL